jgi:hypothetical protein
VNIKMYLKSVVKAWTGHGSGQRQVSAFCERGNEHPDAI